MIVVLLFLVVVYAEQTCLVSKSTEFFVTKLAKACFWSQVAEGQDKKYFCINEQDYERIMNEPALKGNVLAKCTEHDPSTIKNTSLVVGLISKLATFCLVMCAVIGILFIVVVFVGGCSD